MPEADQTGIEEGRRWALDLLSSAYAGGQLDEEELEERVGRALAARTSRELDAAVAEVGLSTDDLAAIVDDVVARWVAEGWQVAAVSDTMAVLVRRRPPNHLLHALLTLVTAGVWLLIWIAMIIGAVDERVVVELDDFGNVAIRRAR